MEEKMSEEVSDFLKRVAIGAGALAVSERKKLSSDDIASKATAKDIVTVADKRVEEYIVGEIRKAFPDHGVWGEETGVSAPDAVYRWVIDPIDGTSSFAHDQRYYSVSIALQKNGETIAGAVYAPRLDELFFADATGAYLNGEPIAASKRSKLIECILATGFACIRANAVKNNLEYLPRILPKLRDIRRCGSAALDLCYVGCGRYDGFWELDLQLYDVAAGAFIARQTGCVISDLDGGDHVPENGTVAINRYIRDEFFEAMHG